MGGYSFGRALRKEIGENPLRCTLAFIQTLSLGTIAVGSAYDYIFSPPAAIIFPDFKLHSDKPAVGWEATFNVQAATPGYIDSVKVTWANRLGFPNPELGTVYLSGLPDRRHTQSELMFVRYLPADMVLCTETYGGGWAKKKQVFSLRIIAFEADDLHVSVRETPSDYESVCDFSRFQQQKTSD